MGKRGGGAGAVQEVSIVPGTGPQLPDVPVKRMQPWTSDNQNCTDIVAGTFDKDGKFEGFVIAEVNLTVLLRYFQLGIGMLPKTLPEEVSGLGQQMVEGYPTIIVTRGTYGRDRDALPGPVRNSNQAQVWDMARKIRAEMPGLHITCVDIPQHASVPQISACLQAPLCEHRELAFYDGVWYIPELAVNPNLSKKLREGLATDRKVKGAAAKKVAFNRKPFAWRNPDGEKTFYQMTWKSVFTDEHYEAPELPDCDETKPKVLAIEAGVNVGKLLRAQQKRDGAASTLALAQSLASGRKVPGTDLDAAGEAAKVALKEAKGDQKKEAEAYAVLTEVAYKREHHVEALQYAKDLLAARAALKDAEGVLAAHQWLVKVHLLRNEPEEAVKAAKDSKEAAAGKGSKLQAAAAKTLVETVMTKGALMEALELAQEAKRTAEAAKDAFGEAQGALLAAKVYEQQGDLDKSHEVLKEGLEKAKQAGDDGLLVSLMSPLIELDIDRFQKDPAGAKEEIMGSARSAVEVGKKSGKADEALSAATLAKAYLLVEDDSAAAATEAQRAVALFEELGGGQGHARSLAVLAQASLNQGKLYSAFWHARLAAGAADEEGDAASGMMAASVMAVVESSSEKPIVFGW